MSFQSAIPLKYLLAFCFTVFFHYATWSQQPNWEFIKGYSTSGNFSIDGQQGVPSVNNRMGLRETAASWKIGNKIYFFGGFGYGADRTSDNLADLWSYDLTTLEWTWLKGGTSVSKSGIYGNKGEAAASNRPGARQSPVAWTNGGKLYLFGGYGLTEGIAINYLNDLWEYDPATNNWTWLKGEKEHNQPGIYGVKGTYDASNQPGARTAALTWVVNGKVYLFGGGGYGVSSGLGPLNDLWEYDTATNQWKWLKGSDNSNASGIYGSIGVGHVNNTPSGRSLGVACTLNDKLYLFGGLANANLYNDLWMYDLALNTWTWLKGSSSTNQLSTYGVQGTAAAANTPGARRSLVAWAANGKMYLFGGNGYANTATAGALNDLWSYQPGTNQWAWLKGGNTTNQTGSYGTKGVAAATNTPGARERTLGWVENNQLYLFRGQYYYPFVSYRQDDIWSYDIASNQWTWLAGEETAAQSGYYGTPGLATVKNQPGARSGATQWTLNGKHYLFGGNGVTPSGSGRLNDLWEYDPATQQWTWLKGSNAPGQEGNYGTIGVAAIANTPGARYYANGWAYDGKLYLFGGRGLTTTATEGILNDLWVFDLQTKNWTYLNGSKQLNEYGNYGTLGVENASNQPRSRYDASAVVVNGKFYLFGGTGYSSFNTAHLPDLWSHNPETGNWTWLKGGPQFPVAGNLAQFSEDYTPGARAGTVAWAVGNRLYLFGGTYYNPNSYTTSYYNDLWAFDTATSYWALMSGDVVANKLGVYGQIGVASAGSRPGGRMSATGITVNSKLYLFGGFGYASNNTIGRLNDVWMYDIASSQWVWHQGSHQTNANGVLSNVPSQNQIGARNSAVSWFNGGYFYIFGGNGYDIAGESNYRGDLWRMELPSDNLTLTSLLPSVGSFSPSFDNEIYTYSLTTSASSFTLIPTLAHYGAKVKVNGSWMASGNTSDPISLDLGNNTVEVMIIAQDGISRTTYTINVNREQALPVTLVSFTAKIENNAAKLQWQTAMEQDNSGFEIYRSGDDKQRIRIAQIAGKNAPGVYNHTDQRPLNGNNYYWLVQIDRDGKTTELGQKVLNFDLSALDISVYPNPATAKTTVTFGAGQYQTLVFSGIDGKVIMKESLTPEQRQTSINVAAYPAGVYIIKLIGTGGSSVHKLIKK
ncbi:kelch repeat-containing protein [Pedobacter sp. SL55]|uniref:Kelch repeat-containing protein n=1 Tax=Pedobacter sp. SL55 TaxID=2995161 RepID=UPI002270745F|nr:kelch repeat-containing protein [Pedobacter sp. SL55]WAC39020.1 cadherin-like beta sandwich domain-containing protein [Pedobacter sp. SL55]